MTSENNRPEILLSVDHISLSFGGVTALEDINFDNIKNKLIFFKQKMFYYKLNLFYKKIPWFGSRACKKKYFKFKF